MKTNKPYAAALQPMLAPNKILGMDIPWTGMTYPKLMSKKYNGIRILGMNGDWYSRNMSIYKINPEVARYFTHLLEYQVANNVVLDGEFNSNSMNTVGQTRSILAGTIPMPSDFMFKCFYEVPYSVWNMAHRVPISALLSTTLPGDRVQCVTQKVIHTQDEALHIIESTAHLNIEGYMFLDPQAFYRHGKASITDKKLGRVAIGKEMLTPEQEILLKFKYYGDDEDAKIVGLSPRQERHSSAPKLQHATGYAKPTYKEEAFDTTDVAGTMICFIEGEPDNMIYAPFPVGFDMEQRRKAYAHFGSGSEYDLQNQWICFRRLLCEDRGKPIAIKKVQFRDSKD